MFAVLRLNIGDDYMNSAVAFWLMLAVVLGVIEAATLSLVSVWGAAAAVLCAVLAAISVPERIVAYVFVVVTLVLVLMTRPVSKRLLKGRKTATNADRVIGAEGTVTKKIEKFNPGEVKVFGQVWTAEAENGGEIEAGKTVKISAIRGVKLFVNEI